MKWITTIAYIAAIFFILLYVTSTGFVIHVGG